MIIFDTTVFAPRLVRTKPPIRVNRAALDFCFLEGNGSHSDPLRILLFFRGMFTSGFTYFISLSKWRRCVILFTVVIGSTLQPLQAKTMSEWTLSECKAIRVISSIVSLCLWLFYGIAVYLQQAVIMVFVFRLCIIMV